MADSRGYGKAVSLNNLYVLAYNTYNTYSFEVVAPASKHLLSSAYSSSHVHEDLNRIFIRRTQVRSLPCLVSPSLALLNLAQIVGFVNVVKRISLCC